MAVTFGSPSSPFPLNSNGNFVYKNEEDREIEFYPWSTGSMDRKEAKEILQRFPTGTFLLRISYRNKGETYKAISVK